MLPPPKRQLRPTNSLPTTAETYGELHGIPGDLQLALQNIGRRGRLAVSQGRARAFDRTQSFPVFTSTPASTAAPFMTDADALSEAEAIIVKEELKARELKPFSSLDAADDASRLRQRGSSPEMPGQEPLRFDVGVRSSPAKEGRGVKRREEHGSEEEHGDTDVDDEDEDEGIDWQEGGRRGVPSTSRSSGSTATADDFPPVFASPKISEPRLFGGSNPSAMPSPFPRAQVGRRTKGLPTRGWGKTVSAPVVSLSGMDVDMDESETAGEDGFDVNEWAKAEAF